jgi:outer membrane immunogenic protein
MKLALAAAALVLCSTGAIAADLAPQATDPAMPSEVVPGWAGFYAGINGGYGLSSSRAAWMHENSPIDDPTFSFAHDFGSLSTKGGFGGVQAGYNLQYGSLVLGLEGDIQGAGASGEAHGSAYKAYPSGSNLDGTYAVSTSSRVDWFATLRPRVGYAVENLLIYATGGVAIGGVNLRQDMHWDAAAIDLAINAHAENGDTRVGYAAGAGVEYLLGRNWSVKAEYQYINLGSTKASALEIYENQTYDYYIHARMRSDFHTLRLGLNYRF